MNIRINPNLTDEQLVKMAQNGLNEAIGVLYTRYFAIVHNRCQSFFHNTEDSADIAQDIMVKVFEHIGNFKGESKFSTWLYAVTFNHCTDQSRKRKKHQMETFCEDFVRFEVPENSPDRSDTIERTEPKIDHLLTFLSSEDRQILIMKYQENKSIRDLQEEYELSASAVKMRLLRARSKAVSAYSSLERPAA